MTNLEFIWPGMIVRGKLNLLQGKPGCGKSLWLADQVARLTAGLPSPGGDPPLWPGGCNVVMVGVEDGIDDTVAPRIAACGGDLERVFHVEAMREEVEEFAFDSFDDLEHLQAACDEVNARVVVFEQLPSHMPPEAGHHDSAVRAAVAGLLSWGAATDRTTLGGRHLRKSGGDATDAGAGSIAWTAIARSQISMKVMPDGRHVLAQGKHNLMPPESVGFGWSFRVEHDGDFSQSIRPVYGERVKVTADELTAPDPREEDGRRSAPKDRAVEILEARLQDGPCAQQDLIAIGLAEQIPAYTMKAAKRKLEIIHKRSGYQGKVYWGHRHDFEGDWHCRVRARNQPNLSASPRRNTTSL